MKKIFLAMIILQSVIACSKDNVQNFNSSIVGKWNYIGSYVNGNLTQIPATSNFPQVINIKNGGTYFYLNNSDTVETGNYSFGNNNSIDSILFRPAIIYTTQNLAPQYARYYQIKKDSLFFIPPPYIIIPVDYQIPVYIKQ